MLQNFKPGPFGIVDILVVGQLVHPSRFEWLALQARVKVPPDRRLKQQVRPRKVDFPVSVGGFRAAIEVCINIGLAAGLQHGENRLQRRMRVHDVFENGKRHNAVKFAKGRIILSGYVVYLKGQVSGYRRFPLGIDANVHACDIACEVAGEDA